MPPSISLWGRQFAPCTHTLLLSTTVSRAAIRGRTGYDQGPSAPFSFTSSSSSPWPPFAMSRSSSTASGAAPIASPSSSVILLSPKNQVLLLHRVKTSTSFASAHVFPGGNLDAFHDGDIPPLDSPQRHQDGPSYRIGAIRETFEETGILLAKKKDGSGELITIENGEREAARKNIHGNKINFSDWVNSIGGVPDTDGLIPFTRWITPTNVPKRFTTQMYLYLLPLEKSSTSLPSEMLVPTPDGGVEHTAATFAPAQTFLRRAAAKEIILFPPQYFLLRLVAKHIHETDGGPLHQTSQREKLIEFLRTVPTAETEKGKQHPTSNITWAEKVMSPHTLFMSKVDNRAVLGLDKPGPELKGSNRGGDWENVVKVKFAKGGPSEVEVRLREDVLEEEKAAKADTKL